MKNSFWGYDKKEVDDNNQYLESVNESLSKKVKQLTKELEEANKRAGEAEDKIQELGSKPVASVHQTQKPVAESPAVDNNSQQIINALVDANNDLKQRNASLETAVAKLQDEIAALRTEAVKPALPSQQVIKNVQIPTIDMEATTELVKGKLRDYVQAVMPGIEDKLAQMDEIQHQIAVLTNGARESFLDMADSVLGLYDSFLNTNGESEGIGSVILDNVGELRQELDDVIDSYEAPEAEVTYEVEVLPEPEPEAESEQEILSESPALDEEPADDAAQAENVDETPDEAAENEQPEPESEFHRVLRDIRRRNSAKDIPVRKESAAYDESAEAPVVRRSEPSIIRIHDSNETPAVNVPAPESSKVVASARTNKEEAGAAPVKHDDFSVMFEAMDINDVINS